MDLYVGNFQALNIRKLRLFFLQDPNPNNRLTTESQDGGSKSYECPHNIVQSIIKVLKARLLQVMDFGLRHEDRLFDVNNLDRLQIIFHKWSCLQKYRNCSKQN